MTDKVFIVEIGFDDTDPRRLTDIHVAAQKFVNEVFRSSRDGVGWTRRYTEDRETHKEATELVSELDYWSDAGWNDWDELDNHIDPGYN